MSDYSKLASQVGSDCGAIEQGVGHKYGALLKAYSMSLSGMALAFYKGWSLALPMLVLAPIILIGLNIFIKQIAQKFIVGAKAFAAAASQSEQAISAIKIVIAFGMEAIEVDNYMRFVKRHQDITGK